MVHRTALRAKPDASSGMFRTIFGSSRMFRVFRAPRRARHLFSPAAVLVLLEPTHIQQARVTFGWRKSSRDYKQGRYGLNSL